MSDKPIEGTAAAAVGAHSKDAMAGAMSGNPANAGRPAATDSSAGSGGSEGIGETIREASADAREAVGKAGASAAAMARTAGDRLSRAGGQAYRQGAQAGEAVGDMVKADPLPALLVAGAVGFALGLLFGRR
jgi:ElaB/YqjD/DUF883 family membrane-anchored ribosome-binding protein